MTKQLEAARDAFEKLCNDYIPSDSNWANEQKEIVRQAILTREIEGGKQIDDFRKSLIAEFTRLKSGQSLRDEVYLNGVIAVIETHHLPTPPTKDE